MSRKLNTILFIYLFILTRVYFLLLILVRDERRETERKRGRERQRGRETERQRERSIDVRQKHQLVASHTCPDQG